MKMTQLVKIEGGYAMGKDIPVIWTCDKGLSKVTAAFDIRQYIKESANIPAELLELSNQAFFKNATQCRNIYELFNNCLFWDINNMETFANKLQNSIESVIGKGPQKRK